MDHPPRESVLGRKVMRRRDLETLDIRYQTSDIRYLEPKVSKSLRLKRASPHKYCGDAAT